MSVSGFVPLLTRSDELVSHVGRDFKIKECRVRPRGMLLLADSLFSVGSSSFQLEIQCRNTATC